MLLILKDQRLRENLVAILHHRSTRDILHIVVDIEVIFVSILQESGDGQHLHSRKLGTDPQTLNDVVHKSIRRLKRTDAPSRPSNLKLVLLAADLHKLFPLAHDCIHIESLDHLGSPAREPLSLAGVLH